MRDTINSEFNMPPGCSTNDPSFTDETEDDAPDCANCGDLADTEREKDDGTIVSLCGECASEPTGVPCSYPGCTRLTTFDPIYGSLCYEHCRAPNE